jgi:hypothetical protein
MKAALCLILISFGLLSPAFGQIPGDEIKIVAENLKFKYLSFDGETNLACTHVLENPKSQDWRVLCGQKNFLVHLWVTAYRRTVEPRLSLEILYWVNGRGGTSWIHLKDAASLHSLYMSQSVEEDTTGLYMDLKISQ